MSGVRVDAGSDIDRSRPLSFSFDGRGFTGFAGDTLASALVANGVRVVGRSFKYHRPRGLLAAGAEEPNALVAVGTGALREVNLRATEVDLADGLAARPVNCWPGARFDLLAVTGLFARFLPAGFYYKTFMWPHWHVFEPFIRRAAGLGRPSDAPDPDLHDMRFAHCDVLVVGAGPAGLAAALAASSGGARVILAEQEARPGGSLRWRAGRVDGIEGAAWAEHCAERLRACAETLVLPRTAAVGYFDHNEVALVQRTVAAPARTVLWRVRAKRVVLATGAIERPIVFPGNDRPGIMLASAVQRFLLQFGARAGKRLVLFTNNDAAYGLLAPFARHGGRVAAVVDPRPGSSQWAKALTGAQEVEIVEGHVVGTAGSPSLARVKVAVADGTSRVIAADTLAVSGGHDPAVHLFRQSGGTLRWDEAGAFFRPDRSAQCEASAGACNGEMELADALAAGHRAGIAAATAAGVPASRPAHKFRPPETDVPAASRRIQPLWRVPGRGKAFVDLQNDVTADDIDLSVREGLTSPEHVKRYTTLGMATDQGKTSNVNALGIMSGILGRPIPELGTTGFRFPYVPVALSSFRGRQRGTLYRPWRRLAAHSGHVEAGALFEEYGGWMRPACYLRPGEDRSDAEQREALAVRTAAGLFDGSPLGKIEVRGPDAAAFLDLIYANTMSTLAPGRLRYGLMLNELGVVFDDGVAARLGEDCFLLATTSAGASRVASWLEEWLQCAWTDLEVLVAPATSSRSVLTVAGPNARAVLEGAGVDFDISADALPHMAFAEGRVAGMPARVSRVSFTGEASFEVMVDWSRAGELWNRLSAAGAPHGLQPVGVDAWMLLRTEKGYLHVGGDTDGTTNALDVGWEHVLRRTGDFVGRRSLTRPSDLAADRLQFVGLASLDGTALPVGAHLTVPGAAAVSSEGYVTSSGRSPILGRGVALGMVRGGRGRLGEVLEARTGNGPRRVRVTRPGDYDGEGVRLRG